MHVKLQRDIAKVIAGRAKERRAIDFDCLDALREATSTFGSHVDYMPLRDLSSLPAVSGCDVHREVQSEEGLAGIGGPKDHRDTVGIDPVLDQIWLGADLQCGGGRQYVGSNLLDPRVHEGCTGFWVKFQHWSAPLARHSSLCPRGR